ncbi:tryptophanase [Escherichia coli]|uniref:tryptophanase n=1 Tax=Escherichia coli TaxID=562 RepID=UPI00300A0DAC
MENFKHLPEPFRIRVIEPVKRTTRAYREEAIIKSGMNPFLLDSEDVFIDLLTDSGTGAVTQSMQAAMMRGDEAYSGSRSYYALAESVKNIFGYQYTIPTHQGRGAEQIYIPVLIKKREQEKGLDRSKMVAFSNYFFDTTQGHSQINGCTVRNVYIKEAFDTGVRYDFKGNFDLEGLERGIEEVGPNNVPYIVATITSNSAGGQPVSLANLKAMYSIAKKYDIPVVMDSARFAENAYFIKQREAEYKDWTIDQILYLRDTISQPVEIHAVIQTYRQTLHRAAFQAAICREPFLHHAKGSALGVHIKEAVVFHAQQAAHRYHRIFLGGHRQHIGIFVGFAGDLLDGLEEIGVVCQQAGGHAAFVDAGKLLPHIPADQFPAQALACELYKVAGIRAVEIGSFLLGRDPKTGKQLPCPAELLRLTIPRATYTQTHMDFIIEAFKHVKENAANIKGLTFTYEPKVLRHFTAKLKEV